MMAIGQSFNPLSENLEVFMPLQTPNYDVSVHAGRLTTKSTLFLLFQIMSIAAPVIATLIFRKEISTGLGNAALKGILAGGIVGGALSQVAALGYGGLGIKTLISDIQHVRAQNANKDYHLEW